VPAEIGLLILFDAMYVLPIVLLGVVVVVLGARARGCNVRALVRRWSPVLLLLLSVAVGVAVIVAGIQGLAG
jgi:hypothetical protein